MCACACARAYLYVSDCAHVFLCTSAACNFSPACCSEEHHRCSDVSPRKTNRTEAIFSRTEGTVKIRAWPRLDLSSSSDSLIHRQITTCSVLKNVLQDFFLYLQLDIVSLRVSSVRPFLCCVGVIDYSWGALGRGSEGNDYSDCERFKVMKREGGIGENMTGEHHTPATFSSSCPPLFFSTFD